MRTPERELTLQAQRADERTVKERRAIEGRERDTGPRISVETGLPGIGVRRER